MINFFDGDTEEPTEEDPEEEGGMSGEEPMKSPMDAMTPEAPME